VICAYILTFVYQLYLANSIPKRIGSRSKGYNFKLTKNDETTKYGGIKTEHTLRAVVPLVNESTCIAYDWMVKGE
jgi:hypothetical protein